MSTPSQVIHNMERIAKLTYKLIKDGDGEGLGKVASAILSDAPESINDMFLNFLFDLEKTAAEEDSGNRMSTLGLMGTVAAGALPLMYYHNKYKKKQKEGKELVQRLFLEEEALRKNPRQTIEHFETIRKYAPSLVAAPEVVRNLMLNWHSMGGQTLQLEILKKMVDLEKATGESQLYRNPALLALMGGLGTGVLSKALPKLIQNMGSMSGGSTPTVSSMKGLMG